MFVGCTGCLSTSGSDFLALCLLSLQADETSDICRLYRRWAAGWLGGGVWPHCGSLLCRPQHQWVTAQQCDGCRVFGGMKKNNWHQSEHVKLSCESSKLLLKVWSSVSNVCEHLFLLEFETVVTAKFYKLAKKKKIWCCVWKRNRGKQSMATLENPKYWPSVVVTQWVPRFC